MTTTTDFQTFILRVEADETGCVVGVVERVRNGEKERFLGYGMLIEIVSRMLAADDVPPARTINAQELRTSSARSAAITCSSRSW